MPILMRMRISGWMILALTLGRLEANDDFTASARASWGAAGEKAASFLIHNQPSEDKSLPADFLQENLDLAFKAREEFPWAKQVPDALFLNDVLPYAVLDEARDPWRAELLEICRPLVKDAKSSGEAALKLNREFFKKINVHYSTERKKPNQSAKESMAQGKASCTGLSILLVEACRAVGIPARAVGTASWVKKSGNHTWVEIWDGSWHFLGADEASDEGLDHGWFVADAAAAKSGDREHAIYATQWAGTTTFPLAWVSGESSVRATEVTDHYQQAAPANVPVLFFRLWDGKKQRLSADYQALDTKGHVIAKGKTASMGQDLNDMPKIPLGSGALTLRLTHGKETREKTIITPEAGTLDLNWDDLEKVDAFSEAVDQWISQPSAESRLSSHPLTRDQATVVLKKLWQARQAELVSERRAELDAKKITLGDKSMPWLEKVFGDAPAEGRSLWISMHGGGNAPPAINDQQWQNQILLYQPAEGYYVAPRAPTNTWNLWHEAHIDDFFQRMIEDYVVLHGVNPNKIYLMGYSAGGDGVWQLAPRMADRFAAASMMAGHPNEASVLGLRNLPFAIFVGAEDSGYDRNKIAADRAKQLDELQKSDPQGYTHMSRIYPGLGHWMDRKDAEAVPWMAQFTRQPWPKKIVWLQDDRIHTRFYWLALGPGHDMKEKDQLTAEVKGQTITLTGKIPQKLSLRLSDQLLNLDQKITVTANGRTVFSGKVTRSAEVIRKSLQERADPQTADYAELAL
jgi:Transglutaminase-like superfamily